jgi:hypothetical protein
MLPQKLEEYRKVLLNISRKTNKKYDYQFGINLSEGFTVTSRCGSVESIEHQDVTVNPSDKFIPN